MLSREKKREFLIENYIRAITLNPNIVCEYEGVYYSYDGKNLIIEDISKSRLDSPKLVIDSVYDVLVVSQNISDFAKNLDLNHIKEIKGNFDVRSSLRSISGKYIKSLSDCCFNYCKHLQTVDFPNLSIIGDDTFYDCETLKYLSLPKLSRMGVNSIAYTDLRELCLGSCDFTQEDEIHSNNKLKKVTFYSVKNLSCRSFRCSSLEYLDLGYFWDNVSYYCFHPRDKDLINISQKDINTITSIVSLLSENKLLVGKLPHNRSNNIILSNELRWFFKNLPNLKELHFKLPIAYKNLQLEDYYIGLFKKLLDENYVDCYLVLDN